MINFLVYAAIGLLLLNAIMYLQQPSMIFFPMRGLEQTPADWGLVYEDVSIVTDDNLQLHGWYIPGSIPGRVLLFFHGNAGNISHRRESLEIFHRLGLNVLIIDYRGYGRSAGKANEYGFYLDADAAWRYLTEEKKFTPDQVIIFGRSLGGAVAAKLASKVQARGLILESTLSSARDFAAVVFKVLSRLVLVRYDFRVVDYIRQVQFPVLVLHSPDDEIMPYRLGEKVFEAANHPKQFYRMRGDHNSGFYLSQPEYEQALGQWLESL